MPWADALNRRLDAWSPPHTTVFGHRWPAFRACGVVSLLLATVFCALLTRKLGFSPGLTLGLIALACASFVVQVLATKVATGHEQLTAYRQLAGVFAALLAGLWASGALALPYLDALSLGLGVLLAGGRVGCFRAGCCHGRAARCGVAYGTAHVARGFPAKLVGVRLFPLQLLESLGVFTLVLALTLASLRGAPPGAALAGFLVGYAALRFTLEFARGDAGRRYLAGLSEAQWTALLSTLGVVGLGQTGLLPYAPWHGAVLGALALVTAGLLPLFPRRPPHAPHPHLRA